MPDEVVSVGSVELDNSERYLAVLAKYGKDLVGAPFHTTEYSKNEINRDTGLDLDEEIEFLNELGVLRRRYLKESSDPEPYFYSLEEDFEEIAKDVTGYIGNNYRGRISKFAEEFSDSDISSLRNDWSIEI